MIMLSFMDSPHTRTAQWLADRREEDPYNFAGVVHDSHLYHLFGDNTNPWATDMDTCKTCCRDTHILKPMWSLGVPTVLGEYGLSTGFAGWESNNFVAAHLENQLSLWNTTRAVVGSFTWNFRILLAHKKKDMYQEWSLLDLVGAGHLQPDLVYRSDLATLCP